MSTTLIMIIVIERNRKNKFTTIRNKNNNYSINYINYISNMS